MIITVTLNPSVDRTVELGAALERGRVQRAVSTRQDPGGKGVNISRALQLNRESTLAVLPADNDDPLLRGLERAGVRYESISVGAPVRSNITVTEPGGVTTKINEPGPDLDSDTIDRIVELLIARCAGAPWLVLAGSVPRGPAPDVYAHIINRVRAALGSAAPRIAVDTSGTPMIEAVSETADSQPDVIKPNGEELADMLGRADGDVLEADPAEAASAARTLIDRGVGAVLCTLGGNGAVLVTREGAWHAIHEPVAVKSTVGAGDSALTGYLLAHVRGESPENCLRQAVAHGSAAAALPGTQMPALDQTSPHAVTVTALQPA